MKKLKWKYDKKNKEWYISESKAWENDGFSIYKEAYGYQLETNGICKLFKKLSTAKKVAQLIYEG